MEELVPLIHPTAVPKPLKEPAVSQSTNVASIRKLVIVGVVCTLFMIAEIIGGLMANSIAILNDAAHLLSDLAGFLVSGIALHIAQRPATSKMTFGFHRAEVIGALISVLLMWGLTIWLVSESVKRILWPVRVDGKIMLITAFFGLSCNLVMFKLLHINPAPPPVKSEIDDIIELFPLQEKQEPAQQTENVNIRAAMLHVLGDLIQSIGVVIAAGVIYFKPDWCVADPLCTLMFAVIVAFITIPVVKECTEVLMEASPLEVDTNELKEDLAAVVGVKEVHDLHVWSLSAGKLSLSVHLISELPAETLEAAARLCKSKYGLSHSTIQVEVLKCLTSKFNCRNRLHQKT
jgi:zinc transporter 2